MGTDIYDIFDQCVSECVNKTDFLGTTEDYYDLDKFLELLEGADRYRVLTLARLIINTQCDENEFLQGCADMITDMDEYRTTIIRHGFGKFDIAGDIPANSKLIITPPPED